MVVFSFSSARVFDHQQCRRLDGGSRAVVERPSVFGADRARLPARGLGGLEADDDRCARRGHELRLDLPHSAAALCLLHLLDPCCAGLQSVLDHRTGCRHVLAELELQPDWVGLADLPGVLFGHVYKACGEVAPFRITRSRDRGGEARREEPSVERADVAPRARLFLGRIRHREGDRDVVRSGGTRLEVPVGQRSLRVGGGCGSDRPAFDVDHAQHLVAVEGHAFAEGDLERERRGPVVLGRRRPLKRGGQRISLYVGRVVHHRRPDDLLVGRILDGVAIGVLHPLEVEAEVLLPGALRARVHIPDLLRDPLPRVRERAARERQGAACALHRFSEVNRAGNSGECFG